jgi:hypothetical protein
MVEEASSVWFLQVAVLSPGGGAPRSSGAVLPPPSSQRFCGAARFGFPFAGDRGTADLVFEDSKVADLHRRDDDGGFRRRSYGIGARRLPAGLGRFLFQGIERSLTSGAPPTALVVSSVVDLQEGRVVFLLFLWTFL